MGPDDSGGDLSKILKVLGFSMLGRIPIVFDVLRFRYCFWHGESPKTHRKSIFKGQHTDFGVVFVVLRMVRFFVCKVFFVKP